MIKRIKAGWRLTKKSWSTLKSDKSLALFPVVSFLTSSFVLVLLIIPATTIGIYLDIDPDNNFVFYGGFLIILLISTFITIFFNVALASQAAKSMQGENANVKDGLKLAFSKKANIFKWSLLAAIVGTILRIIEDRVPFGGRIIGAIGGLAWAIASWFVVPVLAFEDVGPVEALKRSSKTVKSRWGEGVVGRAVIGGAAALMALLFLFIGIGGLILLFSASAPTAVIVLFVIIIFAFLIMLSIISTSLAQIFDTAVYLSITTNAEQVGLFTKEDIDSAVFMKD
jgi:hypothetical protein